MLIERDGGEKERKREREREIKKNFELDNWQEAI